MSLPRKLTLRARLVAGLLFAVAILAAGSFGFQRKVAERRPDDGISWSGEKTARPEVGWVRGESPAELTGIRPGDRLISVNGFAIHGLAEIPGILWDLPEGETAIYLISRDGHLQEFPVVIEYRAATGTLYSYLAIVGLFFLVTGLVVWIRMATDPLASIFFLFCCGQFLLLTFSPTGKAEPFDWVLYWGDLIGRLFTPALILHLALRFPRQPGSRFRFPYPVYIPAALLFLANLYLVGFGGILNFSNPVAALRGKDRFEILVTAVFLLLACGRGVLTYVRSPDSLGQYHLRWVGFGAAVGLLPFTFLYLVPRGINFPGFGGWELSALSLVLLPLFLAAAIAGSRMVELEYFLKKGVTYLAIGFFIIAVFLAASILLTNLLGSYLEAPDRLASALAAVTAGLLVPGVRRLANSLIDHLFYSSRYDLRRTLIEFGRELNGFHDLSDLVTAFTERIRESLGVAESRILVRDGIDIRFRTVPSNQANDRPDGQDEVLEIPAVLSPLLEGEFLTLSGNEGPLGDWIPPTAGGPFPLWIPMRVGGKVTALLAARGEGDGARIPREDRDLLVALCGQAAGALESARLQGELQERVREVERLRQFSEGILDSSRVGIMVVDPDLTIRAWSGAMTGLFGLPRRRAVGRPASDFFPAGFLARIGLDGIGNGANWGQRLSRYSLKTPGRGEIRVNVNVSRMNPRAGSPGGTVVTVDDVTDQVRMEEQLAQKEKLAAVGMLAAGVAHEVNTPLTGISSYAQMLLKGRRNRQEELRMLQQIDSQAFRASEIANRLLDLAGSDGDLHETVGIGEVVEETLALFGPQIRNRGIRLETRIVADGLAVVGNRGRLQQVLLNLLWNAVEAMPDGGSLEVSVGRQGTEAFIEVRDSGKGISRENLSRIFDPFFTTKRGGGGTGLGLSVSYGIVEEHGGRLKVESRSGTGARFTVRLPTVAATARKVG
ncbi:MAG: ATP-binding protein [Acidobacteriota bacterium]